MRGLLSRGKPAPPGFGAPPMPGQSPQMQPSGMGMPGAFSGNPQFQQQLQQMMAQQPFSAPRIGAGMGGAPFMPGGSRPNAPGFSPMGAMPNGFGVGALQGGGGFGGGFDQTQQQNLDAMMQQMTMANGRAEY